MEITRKVATGIPIYHLAFQKDEYVDDVTAIWEVLDSCHLKPQSSDLIVFYCDRFIL